MDDSEAKPTEIQGRYVLIPNPCLTQPCLPGMAYALSAEEKNYFLTVNGRLFSENLRWKHYNPRLNDRITKSGYIRKRNDIFGTPFFLLETLSLIKSS